MSGEGAERTIPLSIRRTLQGGFIKGHAGWLLESWKRNGGRPGYLHPRDPVGRVLAYLWNDDHDEAMIFIADYLAELNVHHELAGQFGTVSLGEVLDGLRLCMPPSFDQLKRLQAQALKDVPGYYGEPV